MPTWRLLGVSFFIWGSLNISWYTLAGIKFTSAQVSSLALRYIFLWVMGLQSVCQVGNQMCCLWYFTFSGLPSLDLQLQAEWLFWSAVLIWVVIWGTSMCMCTTCLYLMHFRLPMLERSLLLLETHTCKMSKLMASFTLVFLHWTLEPLYMHWITTLRTSCLIIMHPSCIKFLLGLHLQMVPLLALILVLWLLKFYTWPFLFVLPSWKLCSLVSEKVDVSSLQVTCYLLNMACSSLRTLVFWQAVSLCLWGTSPNLHCHHWWSWRQTLHHPWKTRICPSAKS